MSKDQETKTGPDLGRAGEVGAEREQDPTGGTPVPTQTGGVLGGMDPEAVALISAMTVGAMKEEEKLSAEDWLSQTFGGSLAATGASDDFEMSGLGMGEGSTLSQIIRQVTRLTEAELNYLQRRLYQAGFYSGTVYANAANISWGSIDQHTAEALQRAFEKAATNRVDNFDQFLSAEAVRFRREGITADGDDLGTALKGDRGERSVVDIVLEDPDAIKMVAESVGTELLGRKPTEEELSRITAKLHADQTAQQKQLAALRDEGATDGGVDFTDQARLLDGGMDVPIDYTPQAGIQLTPEQFENARTIITVGQEMGLSEEYIVGALSAAIVESGLRNVNYGDRDSLGLFQQRPSQGWGTPEQILDPRYSARKFYETMLLSDGATLGERVANTQRPAAQYRGRYADNMDMAAGVLQSILGEPNRQYGLPGQPQTAAGAQQRDTRIQPQQGIALTGGRDDFRRVQRPGQSSVATEVEPVPKAEESDQPFWLDSLVGNSESDPIFNTVMGVDPRASIVEELKRIDPVAYQTRQAALKAYEFFAMLGAGGGLV